MGPGLGRGDALHSGEVGGLGLGDGVGAAGGAADPPPLPTELPQALRLGPPDVASTSVPWWFWDRRGMSTAPSSQGLCSPNPPCPKQRARHLPPTLRGRKEGMKVLLGWTKIPSEALGCWRWDVGEKRLEKVFPHDIARVRSSRITLISDK